MSDDIIQKCLKEASEVVPAHTVFYTCYKKRLEAIQKNVSINEGKIQSAITRARTLNDMLYVMTRESQCTQSMNGFINAILFERSLQNGIR